ncbi:hypothetical protein B0H14DRAFT_2590021 [Mycena olivaceomarginata]|nr:hypothetical protein B0H14DRAFT_2590021 [Mycena olivaceomarginata]
MRTAHNRTTPHVHDPFLAILALNCPPACGILRCMDRRFWVDKKPQARAIGFISSRFHSIQLKDAAVIARKRGHFEYLRQRYLEMRIFIEKWRFVQFPAKVPDHGFVQWPSRSSISTTPQQNSTALFNTNFEGRVVQILDRIRVGNECCFRVMTDDVEAAPRLIHQNDSRYCKVLGDLCCRLPIDMVQKFLASEVRKVTSAPVLDLRSTDSTRQDIEMADTGPLANPQHMDDSTYATSEDSNNRSRSTAEMSTTQENREPTTVPPQTDNSTNSINRLRNVFVKAFKIFSENSCKILAVSNGMWSAPKIFILSRIQRDFDPRLSSVDASEDYLNNG